MSAPVVSVIVPLPSSPPVALACLEGLATLPEEPVHEVVLVVDAGGVLDDLLVRVAGEVEVVRVDRRCGLDGAIAAGLQRVSAPLVAVLRDGAQVTPGWLAALHRVLAGDAGTAVVASVPADGPPRAAVATLGLACRRAALAAAVAAGELEVPDELVMAAICTALGQRGGVAVATDAVVRRAETRSAQARGTWKYGADPELTIVVPTLDATSERLRRCVGALQAGTDAAHEIVIVDNGSPPQGFAAPVNAGLRAGRGTYLVVCNDDVEVLPGWWPPLRARLDQGGGADAEVVFPLTVDGAMREDFAAWCFAMRRGTLERFGVAPGEFFDPSLKVWFQDTDLLVRLRAAGVPPILVRESRIRHGLSETVGTVDPSLRAWIDAQIQRDKATFEVRHGGGVHGAAR